MTVDRTDAAALFEFDYKDYHIRTYLTYSIIEKDGEETIRNMQLFVKDGVLYALNAPDEAVPGAIVIDTYRNESYMTILSRDGRLVDLMDPLVYPENFVNSGIRNLTNNLYSDSTEVMVEYENGQLLAFNYLTGKEVENEKAESLDADFLEYLKSFLKEKLDLVKVELSGAYEDAKRLKDQLEKIGWENLEFADVESEEAAAPVIEGEIPEGSKLQETEEDPDEFAAVHGILDEEFLNGEPGTGEGLAEITGPKSEGGTEADGTGILDEEAASAPMLDGEEAKGQSESANSQMAQGYEGGSLRDGEQGEKETEQEAEAPKGEQASSLPGEELLIVYDSLDASYQLYAEADLLNEPQGQLRSVNERVQEYLDQGHTLSAEQTIDVSGSKVTVSDQRGIAVLLLTGLCMLVLLAVLGVRQYRKDQRGRRRRRG